MLIHLVTVSVLHPKCMGALVQRVVHLRWVARPQARKSLPLRHQAWESSSPSSKTCRHTPHPSLLDPQLCPRCIPIPPPPLPPALWLSRGRTDGRLPRLRLPPPEVAELPQQIPSTATLCLYLALGFRARQRKGRRVSFGPGKFYRIFLFSCIIFAAAFYLFWLLYVYKCVNKRRKVLGMHSFSCVIYVFVLQKAVSLSMQLIFVLGSPPHQTRMKCWAGKCRRIWRTTPTKWTARQTSWLPLSQPELHRLPRTWVA